MSSHSADKSGGELGIDPVTASVAAVGEFDESGAAAAVRALLIAIGEDPERDGLLNTPARVARAYRELTEGLRANEADVLGTTFDNPVIRPSLPGM